MNKDEARIPDPSLPGVLIDIPPPDNDSLVEGIKVDSLQLSEAKMTQHPWSVGQSIGFGLTVIFLIILIGLQTAWFMKETWLQDDEFRKLYTPFYAIMGTDLPPRQDLRLIKTTQLIIQPHRTYADAIRVSILIENTARFEQAFPALLLTFEDSKGRKVSQRKLEPTEYIDTGLFTNTSMPSQQPIQIQLDFMSPGRRASGYQVELLASSESNSIKK